MSFRLAVLIDLSKANLPTFEAYEAAVLPLLDDHGGILESRVRTLDEHLEIHLIRFPDENAFARYRTDPRRVALESEQKRTKAVFDLRVVTNVVGFPK